MSGGIPGMLYQGYVGTEGVVRKKEGPEGENERWGERRSPPAKLGCLRDCKRTSAQEGSRWKL